MIIPVGVENAARVEGWADKIASNIQGATAATIAEFLTQPSFARISPRTAISLRIKSPNVRNVRAVSRLPVPLAKSRTSQT